MTKIIFSLLFLIISMPVFSADLKLFLEQVVTGELDPSFGGEACVFVVRTPEERLLGLVNRDENCVKLTSRLEGDRRKWISVADESLKRIKNKKDLKVLREAVETNATYYNWDGMYDVYSLSYENRKKVESPGLRQLKELGKRMEKEEIGGNAGSTSLYRNLRYSENLNLEEALEQLIYADANANSFWLEEVKVSEITTGDESDLEQAAQELIPSEDMDSWTEFRGKLTDTLTTLANTTSGTKWKYRRYEFLKGIKGADEYSVHFIAVLDVDTDELIVLEQGITE